MAMAEKGGDWAQVSSGVFLPPQGGQTMGARAESGGLARG